MRLTFFTLIAATTLWAEESSSGTPTAAGLTPLQPSELFSFHGQYTVTTQAHPSFSSTQVGDNSLTPQASCKTTNDLTLFLGVRVGTTGEFFINPEVDQGFGLSDTLGLAGYSSGEAYKVGKSTPYLRIPRCFYRQTINWGAADTPLEAGANQFAMTPSKDRLVITVGKFSVVDIFDNNSYAHDAKNDFLNWAVVDAGAFDYAADSWGYTYGAATELVLTNWTWRTGLFALSQFPNSENLDTSFKQFEAVTELERAYTWSTQPGKIKVLLFANQGYMGNYLTALQQAPGNTPPSTAAVRTMNTKSGLALNLEQTITEQLGAFARFSHNDGKTESFDFTDINTSWSLGLMMNGKNWGREKDKTGIAYVQNELSSNAQEYFKAGGMGILIGDGLHPSYAPEQIIELFYSAHLFTGTNLTFDYQFVQNPAYNPDRGPVSLFGLRLHAEF